MKTPRKNSAVRCVHVDEAFAAVARRRPRPGGGSSFNWPEVVSPATVPFAPGQDTRPWQEPLEDWFAGIAAHIYARAGFKLAVTDFEIDVAYDLWRSWGDGTVTADRRIDVHLGSGAQLERFRRTVWA